MARIETLNGPAFIADDAVSRIQGPSITLPYTRVYGVGGLAGLETPEDPDHLADRLEVTPPLVELTRPDGASVWLKGLYVSYVGPPLEIESQIPPPAAVGSRVIVSGMLQLVREPPDVAAKLLRDGGAPI
jgi:hypothetical protein